jgi:hypothetical protein
MRSSICFSPAEDELLAAGWPYMVTFAEGHRDDKRPEQAALTAARRGSKYGGRWPREVLYRYLRGKVALRFDRDALQRDVPPRNYTRAVGVAGAPSKAEAKAWLQDGIGTFATEDTESVSSFVFGVETILGADETLDAIATGFEATTPKPDRRGYLIYKPAFKQSVAETVAFLFHRAGRSARAKYEPRFLQEQARYERAGQKDADVGVVAEGFKLSLARAAGIKKWPGRAGAALLDYAAEDPKWVLSQLLAHPKNPCTVRTIAIAGLDGMEGLAGREFIPSSLGTVLRDFGMIRAPETVELVLSLLGRSSLKDEPLQWLLAHAPYAAPIVAAVAKGKGQKAALALSVKKRLDIAAGRT